MSREDDTRKALRRDVTPGYAMRPLHEYTVSRKKREPKPSELWDAYLKALRDMQAQVVM